MDAYTVPATKTRNALLKKSREYLLSNPLPPVPHLLAVKGGSFGVVSSGVETRSGSHAVRIDMVSCKFPERVPLGTFREGL